MAELEEAGCSRDHTTKKGTHMCHTHLWSYVHDDLAELFIIRRELLILLGEIICVLFQGHNLLKLGAQYWLGAPNGWDTTVARKLSAIVLESPYTWFLSGPPDDPGGSKDCPRISPSTGYYMSPEN